MVKNSHFVGKQDTIRSNIGIFAVKMAKKDTIRSKIDIFEVKVVKNRHFQGEKW